MLEDCDVGGQVVKRMGGEVVGVAQDACLALEGVNNLSDVVFGGCGEVRVIQLNVVCFVGKFG